MSKFINIGNNNIFLLAIDAIENLYLNVPRTDYILTTKSGARHELSTEKGLELINLLTKLPLLSQGICSLQQIDL